MVDSSHRYKSVNGKPLAFHGFSEHYAACHIQDIPENGADFAHLNALHSSFFYPLPGVTHNWENCWWKPGEGENEHLAYLSISQELQFYGMKIPNTFSTTTITQMALGGVQLTFKTPLGNVYIVESITPEHSFLQRIGHIIHADPFVPRAVAKFFLDSTLRQFDRDIPNWSRKTFLSNPLLVKNDGPIRVFRRWAQKFFPIQLSQEKEHKGKEEKASNSDSKMSSSDVSW